MPPSADTAPPLIALGAILHLHSDQGERELPISDFFVGPGRTALGEGELLAEISVPEPHPRSGAHTSDTRHVRKWILPSPASRRLSLSLRTDLLPA